MSDCESNGNDVAFVQSNAEDEKKRESEANNSERILYGIDDEPPWGLSILLGLQVGRKLILHTMVGVPFYLEDC